MASNKLSAEVTALVDSAGHPLVQTIHQLRNAIISVDDKLEENIKWNGPNYSMNGQDRVTMRIHPPKQIQLIFHRGAKVLDQPKDHLIEDKSGMLEWKANDRAVATFKTAQQVTEQEKSIKELIKKWLGATK